MMMPKERKIPWFVLAMALFLLWLFFSLGSYYLVDSFYPAANLVSSPG